jgi:hypothetical protein
MVQKLEWFVVRKSYAIQLVIIILYHLQVRRLVPTTYLRSETDLEH